MVQLDEGTTRLWRVRKTLYEMLRDRGYVVGEKHINETKEEFEAYWHSILQAGGGRHDLVILAQRHGNAADQIIVFFPDEAKKVGVKPIRMLVEKMEERGLSRAILVVQQPLTAFARTDFSHFQAIQECQPKLEIEVFNEAELVVNITRHELVPRHEPLTEESKKLLLQRYKVKENQLPRIQHADPVARYFGLRKGQVMRIIRPSETAGRYVTYRLCV